MRAGSGPRYASNSNAGDARVLGESTGEAKATGKKAERRRRSSAMMGGRRRRSSMGSGLRSSLRASIGIGRDEEAEDGTMVVIEPLDDDEVAALPHYLLGRLTAERINAAAAELGAFVLDKYKLMATPTRAMSNEQLHRYKAYRKHEIPGQTDGKHFFVEADIRNFSHIRVDRTGRAILQILRTTGRLSEIRDSDCVRYCVNN